MSDKNKVWKKGGAKHMVGAGVKGRASWLSLCNSSLLLMTLSWCLLLIFFSAMLALLSPAGSICVIERIFFLAFHISWTSISGLFQGVCSPLQISSIDTDCAPIRKKKEKEERKTLKNGAISCGRTGLHSSTKRPRWSQSRCQCVLQVSGKSQRWPRCLISTVFVLWLVLMATCPRFRRYGGESEASWMSSSRVHCGSGGVAVVLVVWFWFLPQKRLITSVFTEALVGCRKFHWTVWTLNLLNLVMSSYKTDMLRRWMSARLPSSLSITQLPVLNPVNPPEAGLLYQDRIITHRDADFWGGRWCGAFISVVNIKDGT